MSLKKEGMVGKRHIYGTGAGEVKQKTSRVGSRVGEMTACLCGEGKEIKESKGISEEARAGNEQMGWHP